MRPAPKLVQAASEEETLQRSCLQLGPLQRCAFLGPRSTGIGFLRLLLPWDTHAPALRYPNSCLELLMLLYIIPQNSWFHQARLRWNQCPVYGEQTFVRISPGKVNSLCNKERWRRLEFNENEALQERSRWQVIPCRLRVIWNFMILHNF